jgi:outer membrane protein assembly factor BamB
MIAAGRVVYLPPHSEFIHCIDLRTGLVQWKQPRETSDPERIEYIAAATPHSLLLVGRRSCRTLALSTGHELSRHSLDSMPSGRGVRTTTAYLLPLNSGRIVSIDLMDGQLTPASLVAAGSLGNLALAGEQIVSITADTVTAFPQAAVEAARWQSRHSAVDDIASGSAPAVSAGERMLAAEIAVAMGREAEAYGHLQAVARLGDATLAGTARNALRELKLQQLAARRHNVAVARPSEIVRVSVDASAPEHDSVLTELHALASTPEERVSLLMLQAEVQLKLDRPLEALQTMRQVIQSDVMTLVSHPSDGGVRLSPDAWVRGFLDTMSTRYRASPEWPSVASQVRTDIESRRGDPRLNHLHRATIQFASWPDADDLCLEYAQAASAAGQWSAAEAVLLGLRNCGRRETEAAAIRLLAEMWTDAGAYTAAGQAVRDLRNQYADVHVAPDATGREWVRNLGELHIAAQAAERLDRPTWSGRETTVSEQRWTDHRLQATYNSSGMRLLNAPAMAALDVFEAGRGPSGHLQLVNRCTGAEAGHLRLPSKYFYPDCRTDSFVGHLVSVGAPGSLLGISLLNRTVAWTTSPECLPAVNEAVRPGPAGPGFAAFQWRQHLFVVDPGTGRQLWHRSDLDSQSGLMDEPTLGLFGDRNVLVVFGPDRRTFTAFDTNTGAVRHAGRLRCDARQRRLVGRNLLYVSLPDDSGSQSLCLWDPGTAEVLWRRPLDQLHDVTPLAGRPPGSKVYNGVHNNAEFAVVSKTGVVEIVCGETGRERLRVAVDPAWLRNLRDVRVFRDGQRYFINLQQLAAPGEAPTQNTFPTTDATLPLVNVQGVILAVDRSTGRLLWERSFGHRSVLHAPEYGWPVLVTLARVNVNNQLALQVEVVDAATGEVLASRDGLYSNRLLQMLYDHESARLTLKGAGTEIRLHFLGQKPAAAKTRQVETRYLTGR